MIFRLAFSFLGTGWCVVEPPEGQTLSQISLGNRSLWAITKDQRVWFRSGINSQVAGVSEDMAKGTTWVSMTGTMSHLSVASNDQVFAVGINDRYFTGGCHGGGYSLVFQILHSVLGPKRRPPTKYLMRTCIALWVFS